ncbi:hypothetical protein C806_04716 [Lachnospiraceae bacterium 3-1]|nr:hypothetical protein C806_04716 [Lachnospiraceae bacterium 3-1]
MGKVELLGYKVSRLELLNELEESGEVRLSDHMEFSVSFEPGEDMAVAVLEQYLGMKGPSKFCLKLVLEGIFHVDGIRNGKFPKKEQLKCYDSLFPYADQIIRMLSIERLDGGGSGEKRPGACKCGQWGKPKNCGG